jgi:hypothetical protein
MTSGIRVIERKNECKTSIITENYSHEHCIGIRWNSIYKIRPVINGIKIYHSWQGQGGCEVLIIPFDKKTPESEIEQAHNEFIKIRNEHLNKMLLFMHKNGEVTS